MNKQLRNLYDKCLKEKWLPLMEDWNEFHDFENFIESRITSQCAFCKDTIERCDIFDCDLCKINHKICNKYGRRGFYSLVHQLNEDSNNMILEDKYMEKYLKKMIRMLKIEKFKCIFKPNPAWIKYYNKQCG